MSSLVLTVKGVRASSAPGVTRSADESLIGIRNYLDAALCGAANASVDVQTSTTDPVAASGTFTLTSAIATDAITIGSVTMTATSTPTLATHWEIDGADDTADAASLAAAINANTTLNKVVVATSALGVVTVRALQKGVLGNQVAISSADATIVASASFLAGGTGGVQSAGDTFSFGL